MAKKAYVSEAKKETVKKIVDLIKQYPVIASIDMENMPANALQKMRAQLRGKVAITMTKRRVMKVAFEQAKDSKKGIENIIPHLTGMPALMFTKESPFKLSKILQKSRSPAPAKAGQLAPRDIVVNKGPTPFAPGPIISELSMAGIKAGVEGGKVTVKEDSVVAKKGDKINAKVAGILTRLGIEPMEIGLTLTAAYENGIIYGKEVLEIDEKGTLEKLSQANSSAFNLSIFAGYPTKDTIELLLSKAFNDAKALGISEKIIDKDIIDALIGQAEASMSSLKNAAGIEITEKPKEVPKAEEKKEEPKAEDKKPEVKKEETKPEVKTPKVEEKKPEVKKEEKKPEIKEEPKEIEKKEEKILEEEKEIIKEEIKLEKQKPKEEAPIEKEAEKALKEEEEKQLEKERIEKEKEFEKIEKRKAEEAKKQVVKKEKIIVKKEPKPRDKVDKKVEEMVEQIKKHGKVQEKTAQQIIDEVKTEEPKKEEKKEDEVKKVENLFEELKKKGTLRK